MRQLNAIIKKELFRFFSDKRLLLSAFIPGLFIIILYFFIGKFAAPTYDYVNSDYTIYVQNLTEEQTSVLEDIDLNISIKEMSKDSALSSIIKEDAQLFIQYDSTNSTPNFNMYYKSSDELSTYLYNVAYDKLYENGTTVEYKYTINSENFTYDLATKDEISRNFVSMLGPYLLGILLFTGCMAISGTAISGEKERGTMATVLVTSTKRSTIAFGKVIALSIIGLFESIISFISTLISLPLMTDNNVNISLSSYDISTFFQLLLIIILTTLFYTILLCITSTISKTVNESNSYSMPLMAIIMVIGLLIMQGSSAFSTYFYIIPIFNNILCFSTIFSGDVTFVNILLVSLSDIIYIFLGVYIIKKLFNSEHIMMTKS